MLNEVELKQNFLPQKRLHSIYFGGGTPSLLTKKQLALLLNAVHKYFSLSENAEITFEVNPENITNENLKLWQHHGINRLSIGVQSFNDNELTWMNRGHNSVKAINSVKAAQDVGYNAISIDLIFGSKFSSVKQWEESLKKAIDLNVDHISAYNLTIEKRTRLGKSFELKREPEIDSQLCENQFLTAHTLLEKAGFEHYEISNYAKQQKIAVHNSNYWLQKPYLGIGPSAHSFTNNTRSWNIANNNIYIDALLKKQAVNYFESEHLSIKEQYNEYVLLGLRSKFGCSLNYIETHFGSHYIKHFESNIKSLAAYYTTVNNTVYLTLDGWLLADKISSMLFI